MVAMLLEELLGEAGYEVLLAATLAHATTLATTETIDLAVLDVRLGRDDSFPLAEQLRARGVPFLFASGHGRDGVPPHFAEATVLQKPYDMTSLKHVLTELLPAR